MKVRDSGMPDEAMWSEFFDTRVILDQMEITGRLKNVVDLGSGYGTFSIPVARMIQGTVHAFDIEPEMIEFLQIKADQLNITNIESHLQDFITEGTGLPDNSTDYVMLFNILHNENPEQLLNETFRILKPGAKAGIIHWRSDILTPRGPRLDIRPKPAECRRWAEESGFNIIKELTIKPYHFGIIIQKG